MMQLCDIENIPIVGIVNSGMYVSDCSKFVMYYAHSVSKEEVLLLVG